MGSTNLHYQDGEDRMKKASISIEDMIELDKKKEGAKELWTADVEALRHKLEKYEGNFDLWFDEVYTPEALLNKKHNEDY